MEKRLSQSQAIYILSMFIVGTSIISGVAKDSKDSAWIAIIVGAIISLPIYMILASLLKAYRNKNIYEICEIVLGRWLGKGIGLLLIFNGIYLSAILIRKVSEFMSISGLTDTPLMLIVLLVISVSIYMMKKGVGIFGKWCQFYFWIIMLVLIIEIIFLGEDRNFDHLYPLFYNGIEPIIKGTYSVLGFPMLQVAHLLGFFNLLDEQVSYRKVFFTGWIIATCILLIITLDNILVLGPDLFSDAYFPSYVTFRMLSIGNFFQKVESLMVLSYLIYGFVKYTSSLFTTVIGFQKIFNLQSYKGLIVPVSFLCSILAYLTYEDLIEVEYIFTDVYIPYSIVINGLLPALIYVVHLIRRKSLNT